MSGMYSQLTSNQNKTTPPKPEPKVEEQPEPKVEEQPEPKTEVVEQKSTPTPVKKTKSSKSDITTSPHQSITTSVFSDVVTDDIVQAIHKSMRDASSTMGSYRCSPMEKKRLEVTVFELKNRSMYSADHQDFRVNENDIIRIALNHMINEYKANGDDSVLVKTLESLRS